MSKCKHCHQPQTAGLVICSKCYEALTAQLTDLQKRYDKLNDFEQSQCAKLLAQLTEKDKQLAAAVEDLRGLCWCCANGKKWDKAPVWSNMTTCEHIRERGSLAVGGGKAGKDCPHWKWRRPQAAGEVDNAD